MLIKQYQASLHRMPFLFNLITFDSLTNLLSLSEIYQQFILDMQHTSLPEYIAVFFGIAKCMV